MMAHAQGAGSGAQDVVERFGRDFSKRFFSSLGGEMLAPPEEARLVEGSIHLLAFAALRSPGRAAVLVGGSGSRSVFIVNDDMPFLVDSVVGCLEGLGMDVDRIVHPVMPVTRDDAGAMIALGTGAPESLILVLLKEDVEGGAGGAMGMQIAETLLEALEDVRASVADWKPMIAVAESARATLAHEAASHPEQGELASFVQWLTEGHFTFLGIREYRAGKSGLASLNGLGILREARAEPFDVQPFAAAGPQAPRVVVTKTHALATVHRRVPMDVLVVRLAGNEAGGQNPTMPEARLLLILGLFTSRAYARAPADIPLLRGKVAAVAERTGHAPGSHNGKLVAQILDTYPRDELFELTESELLNATLQLVSLEQRPRFGLFRRFDRYGGFLSLMIYMPRDRFDAPLRQRLEKAALAVVPRASHLLTSTFSSSPGDELARLHLVISTDAGAVLALDAIDLEAILANEASDWSERLEHVLRALAPSHAGGNAAAVSVRYRDAFPQSYRSIVTPLEALADIEAIEAVCARSDDLPVLRTSASTEAAPRAGLCFLTLYRRGEPLALSDLLPILERFGFRILTESAFPVVPSGLPEVALQRLSVEVADESLLAGAGTRLADAFTSIWRGEAESDGFDRLVLRAGLTGRQVTILRAYAKYLRQTRFRFTQDAMEAGFASYPQFGRLFVELFETIHDPDAREGAEARSQAVETRILAALDSVANADDDAIFRTVLLLIRSTLRTNFFQRGSAQLGAGGEARPALAMKIDSQAIASLLPPPRPLVEIFVYAARFEAVHLRGGRIARGGIRWSDRREDFRTEILGLMKAQMVKNTVIVPVGSKGGFVLKRPPTGVLAASRAALQEEGIACYRLMMQSLLDITDNLASDGTILPPDDVARLDGDDPYLVVAADKGTASFSDIANAVSRSYGFWLDDAFASGGSSGYDHKRMGITARGAWESVKRHFRELRKDVQTDPVTVVGVGDMSGDVFGNGMLQSESLRLVAAFDHRHIFIDPTPNAAPSYAERRRLFALPASSWGDYDQSLISLGGGVYPRSAKIIDLSAQAQAALGITSPRLSPSELVRTILRAPVDLLFFGGIGTYVKAPGESNADVGDRTNDANRIDGDSVRALVVAEGANLGVTQAGRIAYAARGGRINTDFIDNSAGVDTSDHEVNIKILLKPLLDGGTITLETRDNLLVGMTNEVAALVLEDNFQQTQTLSRLEARAGASFETDIRFMRELEKHGLLDRAVENLPADEQLAVRAASGQGLTRPELAVLLAYGKITAYDQLIGEGFEPADFEIELSRYFPQALREGYPAAIRLHALRREIVITRIVNALINRVGPTFLHDMWVRTGAERGLIVLAFLRVRAAFDLQRIWTEIESLNGTVPAREQTRMMLETEALLYAVVPRLLRPAAPGGAAYDTLRDQAAVAALAEAMRAADPVLIRETQTIPPRFRLLALFSRLTTALDLAALASRTGLDVTMLAGLYVEVLDRFGIAWFTQTATNLPRASDAERRAIDAMIDEAWDHGEELTARIAGKGARMPWIASCTATSPTFHGWTMC